MKYIVIGAGSRGSIYGTWAHQNGIEIAAVAELRPDRLEEAGKLWNVPENMRFTNVADLFALGKIADAAIVATMDRDHFGHVMAALDCGYDILLEKPISPDPRECIAIEEKANALNEIVDKDDFKTTTDGTLTRQYANTEAQIAVVEKQLADVQAQIALYESKSSNYLLTCQYNRMYPVQLQEFHPV